MLIHPLFGGIIVDDSISTVANSDGGIGVDFSFFTTDDAKIQGESVETSGKKKKNTKPKVVVNGEVMPDAQLANPIPGANVAEVDYAKTYNETNALIRGAILQADELSAEIKSDIDAVRAS